MQTPDNPEPDINENAAKRRKFFTGLPLRIAASLRDRLPCNEWGYLHAAGFSHADARAFFLYGVLDEVQKAASASIRWSSFLDEPAVDVENPRKPDYINRLTVEAVLDEQNMWVRKLVELLVDLICFSQTNDQPYYRIYLAARYLSALLGHQQDFLTFHDGESANIQHSIDQVRAVIAAEAAHVNPGDVWFLRKDALTNPKLHPGRVFVSLRNRFCLALKRARPEEQLALRCGYGDGYGSPSRAVHSSVGLFRWDSDEQMVDMYLEYVGFISFHLLMRVHELSGLEPIGDAVNLARFYDEGSHGPLLLQEVYQREFAVGDIVLANGDLAEVLERRESAYGYTSYGFRYLAAPPIPGIDEDWLPGRALRPLVRRHGALDNIVRNLAERGEDEETLEGMRNWSEDEAYEALKEFYVMAAKAGVLDRMLSGAKSESSASTPPDRA